VLGGGGYVERMPVERRVKEFINGNHTQQDGKEGQDKDGMMK